MEGNLHSFAGEIMPQMRPEGKLHAREDKMHTSQIGGHLAHPRWENAWKTSQEDSFNRAGDSRHQGYLHAAEGQLLQTLGNEVNFHATE